MKKLYKLLKHQEINNFVDIGYQSVGELFNSKVLENRDKIFLICPGSNLEKFTYLQFYEMVEKTIMFLENYELKKNDIISIIFTNSVEFLLIYFAGLRMGLTIVPINPDITSNEMRFIINNSKSLFTFYDYKFEPKIKDLKKTSSNFISIRSKMDLINIEKSKKLKNPKIFPEDLGVIIYTSGTTGNPKGVKLSHLNLLADAKSISEWFHFDINTRTLCILPLFHNNGQITTLLAPLYGGGSTIIVKGKISLMSFWEIVNEYQATWTSVMASILSILLTIPKNRIDNSLKAILCGGQVLTRTVQENFEKKFNISIYEGYGLTETTSFSCINNFPSEKRQIGSIGKPLLTNEMAIFDEHDKEILDGSEGEICIRGFNVSIGYLELEEKNKISFRNGWFHSGDYGHRDENGYFYIHGRKDSLIIKGGENIYPAEIENILYKFGAVDECAVIGIPDKLLGEEICAFVKVKEKDFEINEFNDFIKNHLASFKQPKKIIIINQLKDMKEIPKGPTKKILYKDLKNYYKNLE